MTKYIIKRLLMIIPILLGVIIILFLILYYIPASNVRFMTMRGDGDFLDSVFNFFNAGESLITKYLRYCYNVFFKFDFGRSGRMLPRLTFELRYRVSNTLSLLLCGVGATMIAGIPLGIVCALRKNRTLDRIISVITLILASIPSYSMAMLVTLLLVLSLNLLPLIPSYTSPVAFILPMITISLGGISAIARMTRASMLEVLDQPYITALRSKGLRNAAIIWRHGLKNAFVPIVSVLGGLIAQLLCGTFVVEYFFTIPGLGTLMLKSVSMRDHFSILGCTVVLTVILSVTNTAADILYALINPQIRLQYNNANRLSD